MPLGFSIRFMRRAQACAVRAVGRPQPQLPSTYSNTNGSPCANSALTMITLTRPIERKGWLSTSVTPRPHTRRRHGPFWPIVRQAGLEATKTLVSGGRAAAGGLSER